MALEQLGVVQIERLLVCSADADCAYLTVYQMQLPEAVAPI
jgi:hypothetical protein